MKANTINLYMDSVVNGKRVGDMTYDELHELAKKWILVQGKCKHLACSGRLMMPRGSSSSSAERIS